MVYKKPKENVYWKYVHADGNPCPKGAHGVCKRKCSRPNREEDMELPDLPVSPMPATRSVVTRSMASSDDNAAAENIESIAITTTEMTVMTDSRSVITTTTTIASSSVAADPVVLVSPLAINRITEMHSTPRPNTRNLNNLLCTLNFDVRPENLVGTARIDLPRSGVTPQENVHESPETPMTLEKSITDQKMHHGVSTTDIQENTTNSTNTAKKQKCMTLMSSQTLDTNRNNDTISANTN